MPKISILFPSYNEEEQLPITVGEVLKYVPEQYDCDLLFVDDGSTDQSWTVLKQLADNYPQVKALRFSRNFGKEAALVAGLAEVEGDAVIIMDCDLQFPPRYIPQILEYWEEGYEVVEGVKAKRQDESAFAGFAANSFYHIFKALTELDLKNASDFKLLDRKVIDIWKQMPERASFFRGQSAWVGFKRKSFSFEVDERKTGEGKWSIIKLSRLAINAITSFSAKPLYLIALVGLILFILFIILGIQTLINWFRGTAAGGFTTVILLQLLIGGTILLSLGLIGVYIERIYLESKGRPRYIISDRIENEPDSRKTE